MEVLAKDTAALARAAADFIRSLSPQKEAAVVGLYGDLGAGKTAFVKAVAEALRVEEPVTSPTFVIEKIYKLSDAPFSHLVHIDAYRLEGPRELVAIGWETLKRDPANLIFIEWAERVEPLLPANATRVRFSYGDEETRRISW